MYLQIPNISIIVMKMNKYRLSKICEHRLNSQKTDNVIDRTHVIDDLSRFIVNHLKYAGWK